MHPLSILAAPERVLFVYRRLDSIGFPLLCDTCTSEQDFGRATIHMIGYLNYNVVLTRLEMSLKGIYHGE